MTPKDQLTRLVQIQEVVTSVRQAEKVIETAPSRIEEIEERFRERNAEFVAIQGRYDELELDRKTRSTALTDLEANKVKFNEDLMQVKNQKEYAAILKEIDSVKAQISEHEEAILRDMEEIEKLKGELATHEEHIKQEREAVEQETTEVRNAEASAKETIAALGGKRDELEQGMPVALLKAVKRIELRRQGLFLAEAIDGTCQTCFVRCRPQVFQEIRQATAVHSCSNCRRYLYYPDSVAPAAPQQPAADSGNVETVNGGAV